MKLGKTYEPQKTEQATYDLWEKSGAFKPSGDGQPFSIIMPPPNANANLHIGQALMAALEDLIIRYHRLKGHKTLFLPGADHAGFETQAVYEKELAREGKSRFDFTRDELFDRIWDFVEQNKGKQQAQIKALGASPDWDRFTYTLAPHIVDTAYKTFKKLWDDGLVYRGERLVNYCTHHRTGFADIEVEYKEKKSPLYYLKYGPFTLATTRPETKFGDTAIAVHPDDKRYKKYVDKVIQAEGVNGPFEIRVVADEMVDMKFGTGAVKITPAHDFNDWEVAKRHDLPALRVINHDGTLNHEAGKFAGMPIEQARKAVVEALKAKGLLEKVDEDYINRVGVCYKCGTTIEPMLMDQWFIKVEPLASAAIKAIKGDEITFYPASKRKILLNYLENLHDWNISRQIAWGIPIPAFQNVDDPDDWLFDTRVKQEIIEVDGKNYRRDPDVFDTWFSSGQWPFATLKYPDSQDFKQYYPNSVMETGHDILFQWVARMIMLGIYVTGKIPFETVYLHGLVTDPQGQKMSKSKGNVVNPMDVLEEYGSDALRMGLISGRSAGLSQPFTPDKVISGRNFANKLWNVARYIDGVLGDDFNLEKPKPLSPADHWVLERINNASRGITKQLDRYRFSEAYDTLYHCVWDDFADWYLEASKAGPNTHVLAHGLKTLLMLAHPFAPFVTETIWQALSWTNGLLISANWPQEFDSGKAEARRFEELKTLISNARELKSVLQTSELALLYTKDNHLLDQNRELVTVLAGVELVESEEATGLKMGNQNVWADLSPAELKKYRATLQKRADELKLRAESLKKRLASDAYVKSAPKNLVEQSRSQLAEAEDDIKRIQTQIQAAKD